MERYTTSHANRPITVVPLSFAHGVLTPGTTLTTSRTTGRRIWYTVFAGGLALTRRPFGRLHSHLAWYEGAVMAFSNREAAAVFARERRLPQATRVFVTGFTTSSATEVFTVGTANTLE